MSRATGNSLLIDAFRGHRLDPAYTGRSQGDRSSQGFRNQDLFPLKKPEDRYRILLMGASTVFGLGANTPYPPAPPLELNETLNARLQEIFEAELSAYPRRIEIINTGVKAYQIFQQLVYLNESLLYYEPDAVLIVEGNNDYYVAASDEGPWRRYPYSSPLWMSGMNQRTPMFTTLIGVRYLARWSWFFTWAERRLTKLFQAQERGRLQRYSFLNDASLALPDEATFRSLARDNLTRHYSQIAALGTLYGFRTIVVVQPQLVFEDPRELGPKDRTTRQSTLELAGLDERRCELSRAYVPLINDALAEVKRRFAQDFDHFDHHRIAVEPRDSDRQLYKDYCHLTPIGTRLLAQLIADDILPLIRTDLDPGQR